MSAVQNLPYLNAVLEESLRVYPPAAFSQARVTPPEGAVICGEAVPGGTSVGVATWAASLSEHNWTEPNAFKPERWLGDGWTGDDQKAMQPFSVGPRNCIGKKSVEYLRIRRPCRQRSSLHAEKYCWNTRLMRSLTALRTWKCDLS